MLCVTVISQYVRTELELPTAISIPRDSAGISDPRAYTHGRDFRRCGHLGWLRGFGWFGYFTLDWYCYFGRFVYSGWFGYFGRFAYSTLDWCGYSTLHWRALARTPER